MQVQRRHIQHWNQVEEAVSRESFSVKVGPATFTLNPFHSYGSYWNPSRGNVRVGNQEVKWYNTLRK